MRCSIAQFWWLDFDLPFWSWSQLKVLVSKKLSYDPRAKRPHESKETSSIRKDQMALRAYTTVMDMEAKVIISYRSLFKRGSSPFQLFVDDRKVGDVKHYDREYAVEPGNHLADVRYLFIKTNKISFSLRTGDEVRLSCVPNFWIMLVPLSIGLIYAVISIIPYSPTLMLYAGATFVLLAPIYVVLMIMRPGAIVKLRIET